MTREDKMNKERALCPRCKRDICVASGQIGQHGPDKNGDFICKGSGTAVRCPYTPQVGDKEIA